MPVHKAIVTLPLPRVIEGTLKRCQNPERVAVYDEVPLEIAELDAAAAPVALRIVRNDRDAETFGDAWRAHGGAFWRPLDYGRELDGIRPRDFGPVFLNRLARELKLPGDCLDPAMRQEFADWGKVFQDVNRKRGLYPAAAHEFTSIADDGRAWQAGLVRRLMGNLILVDGRLHHRALAPDYWVSPHFEQVNVGATDVHWEAGPKGEERSWASFPPDRLEDAKAFAAALGAMNRRDGREVTVKVLRSYEIVDPAALASALPEPSLATVSTPPLGRFVDSARSSIGHLEDRHVETFLWLRSLARDGIPSGEAAVQAMEAVRELTEAIEEHAQGLFPGSQREEFKAAATTGRIVLLRHETVDAPRFLRDADDELALGGLGL